MHVEIKNGIFEFTYKQERRKIMNYIDQHMHTYFSSDSKEKFESYLKLTDGKIITTEHLDLMSPSYNHEDRPLDLDGYMETIDKLNQEYDNRILKGIEVGFSVRNYKRILEVLDKYHFDSVLLSLHYNDEYDYMNREIGYDKTPSVLIPEYLNNLVMAVKTIGDRANILTHFDYGFRISDVSVEDLKKYGEDLLIELIEALKDKKMSLEINTRSIYDFDNSDLYEYFVPLYLKHGGTEIAVGSDAHKATDYKLKFKEVLLWLDSLGVKHVNQFINQKAEKVMIQDLI